MSFICRHMSSIDFDDVKCASIVVKIENSTKLIGDEFILNLETIHDFFDTYLPDGVSVEDDDIDVRDDNVLDVLAEVNYHVTGKEYGAYYDSGMEQWYPPEEEICDDFDDKLKEIKKALPSGSLVSIKSFAA